MHSPTVVLVVKATAKVSYISDTSILEAKGNNNYYNRVELAGGRWTLEVDDYWTFSTVLQALCHKHKARPNKKKTTRVINHTQNEEYTAYKMFKHATEDINVKLVHYYGGNFKLVAIRRAASSWIGTMETQYLNIPEMLMV